MKIPPPSLLFEDKTVNIEKYIQKYIKKLFTSHIHQLKLKSAVYLSEAVENVKKQTNKHWAWGNKMVSCLGDRINDLQRPFHLSV